LKKLRPARKKKNKTKVSVSRNANFHKFLIIVLLLAFVLPDFTFSQENLAQICKLEEIEKECNIVSQIKCQQLLEKCDAYYQAESERIGKDITKTQQEQKTLQSKVSSLRSRIQQLDLQIQQGNVMIKDLSYQIGDTESSIEQTSLKIEDLKGKLAVILQTIYEEDQSSIIEVLLSNANLSDFFDNLMALENLNLKSREFLGEIKDLKTILEEQKDSLNTEKSNLERVVQIQYVQKQESQTTRSEQEKLLQMTEVQYQQHLKEKEEVEKTSAEIRAKIIELIGIPIGEVPEFGDLIKIAENVAKVVGIRPAFLLGVISQESALGRNIGQCYITNTQTGGGVFISTGKPVNRIMNATRDLPIFLRITGDNFKKMPVSCWIPVCYLVGAKSLSLSYKNISIDSTGNIKCPAGYAPYGFGGAMGPAQFIPSTWQLYEGKLISLFGISSPNPWNVRDALAASSLYLSELGATSRTRAAEITAANRYFGGSYSNYGSQVLQRADCVQSFINTSTMTQTCQNLLGLRLR
jgi:peptidoglycan hydrolase CwlO-like protein